MLTSDSEFDTAKIASRFVNMSVPGVYVDVGAGFPTGSYNNATMFRNAGWKIISVEPNPRMCERFRQCGYEICQYAAYKEDLGKASFEIHNAADGMGGSQLEGVPLGSSHPGYNPHDHELLVENGHIKLIEVEALTLNTILTRHYPEVQHIDILDLDVEGYELEVFAGLDLKKYNPDVLIVENLGYDPLVDGNVLYYEYYKKIGYKVVARAACNEILIRDK